jgi:DNA-binding CsgD family transcriptional regulator
MLREARARLRLVRGDRAGAVADLRLAAEVYVPLRISPIRSSWRSLLALALAPDDREEAMTWAAEEVDLAEQAGLPRPLGIALRRAATVGGEEDEVERLRRSVELLAGTRARLEHARSLLALGSALRRRAHRAEAREPLAAALEIAHRCGAERTEARAAEELRAAGARPRRPVRTGLDALTASEARVARLVAGGRSNAEVAQELFVSLKTVETHLGRAYSKLGLSGRSARGRLSGVLGRETT